MAISTYNELLAAVENHLDRSDLDDRIPEFISIAEAKIGRKLRITEMETEADVTMVAGTRTVALPTGFREVRRMYLNTSPVRLLEYLTPQDYWARNASTQTGTPVCFTVEGANFLFGPIPGSSQVAKCLYFKGLAAVSASAHAVFTANPDLYVYGALTAAEPYLKNDKRVPMWKALFEEIIQELDTQSRKHQGPMRMRDDYNPA
jgi:hypothetical protein